MPVRAVFFDIGETLIDETRIWSAWADWLGVPRLTFLGALGSVIERGEHHLEVFKLFRPDFELDREETARAAAGIPNLFDARDLYPDVLECVQALKAHGYFVGLAGNQHAWAGPLMEGFGLPVDFVGVSEALGVAKPAPEFFERLVEASRLPAQEIAYVGDRLDNDVIPAKAAGMVSVFLRRGPWGVIHARRPEAAQADIRILGLTELPGALRLYSKRA